MLHNEHQLRLLYRSHIPCIENNPLNLTKYESKGTSKIPIFQLLSELGTTWKRSLSLKSKYSLIFKYPNFQSLPRIGKNWEVQLEQHLRILICEFESISLWIGKNLEVQPKTEIQKSQFWIYRWIGSYVLI